MFLFYIPKKNNRTYDLLEDSHFDDVTSDNILPFFHTKQVDSSMIYHWTDVQQHGIYSFKLINPPFPWPHYIEEMFVCISLYKEVYLNLVITMLKKID